MCKFHSVIVRNVPPCVYLTLPMVMVTYHYNCQAEQIMEAIELYKEERLKQLEYEEECKAAGKKVKTVVIL